MRKPLQERAKVSTRQMIDAAVRVVAANGLAGMTVADVALESGVSNGALYHRFDDRLGLLLATQEQFLSNIEEEFSRLVKYADTKPNNDEMMTTFVDGYLDLVVAHRRLFRAFSVEGHSIDELRERGAVTANHLSSLLRALFIPRYGCTVNAAESTHRLLMSLMAYSALYYQGEEALDHPLSLEELKRHTRRALMGALSP